MMECTVYVPNINQMTANLRITRHNDIPAEIVLHQILHSAVLKLIDSEFSSTRALSTYFHSLLSCENITAYVNNRWANQYGEAISIVAYIPLSIVGYPRIVCLFNSLQMLFYIPIDENNGPRFNRDSLYLFTLSFVDYGINHYIYHKKTNNKADTIIKPATANSNIAFNRWNNSALSGTDLNLADVPSDCEFQVLLQELITSLTQLTDPILFETVSNTFLNCTELPLVLIELLLQYMCSTES